MKIITIKQYFGIKMVHADATLECVEAAKFLLVKVNALLLDAQVRGKLRMENNPQTGCLISGSKGGDGGFRLSMTITGKPSSSHKIGRGVDIYDPANKLDDWLTRDILVTHDLYREAAPFTLTWTHLTDRAPRSGNRSFIP